MAKQTQKPSEQKSREDGIAVGVARVIVSLMWGILLAVVVFVAYLASRFFG